MNSAFKKFVLFTLSPALAGFGAMWFVIISATGGLYKLQAVLDAAISVGLLALFSLVIGNILKYYRPTGGREWNLIAWIVVFAGIWWLASSKTVGFLVKNNADYSSLISHTFTLRLFMAILVLTCVALITWVRKQSASNEKSQARFNEIDKLAKDAELNALRQQLQPHFLFNSLNSIQALIATDPETAHRMVIQLSDFLRGTLRQDNLAMQTVEEEIEHTRLYLEIEKVRFGERLMVTLNVDEAYNNRQIPALILQPLVENAIKHGVYQTTGPVEIKIMVSGNASHTELTVQNPYDAKFVNHTKGTGFGLSSVGRRLFLLYNEPQLMVTQADESIYSVNIKIPNK
ncbi:MAG: histidine kinase [Bacteroidia bacterium]|nr:histidine kinase [Bacteroidia bacterium]